MFEAASCDRYFTDYTSEIPEEWKITISMLNISLLLVLEQKIVLPGYRKSCPINLNIYLCLTFDLYFKVKPRSECLF
jgi:hypothetical protein